MASSSNLRNRPDFRILTGLIVTLLVCAFVQFTTVTETVVDTPIRADAADYVAYAHNLKEFGIYSRSLAIAGEGQNGSPLPDSLRAPGYPLFLTMFLDRDLTADGLVKRVTLAQAGISVLCVLLVFLLAKEVIGARWALIAALAQAVAPHFATASTYLLTETLFTACVLAFACLLAFGWRSQRLILFLLAGVALGAACLVRPTLQLLPLLAILSIPFLWNSVRGKGLGILLFGFCVAYSPWLIRNALLHENKGSPSLTVNQLLHGSYPGMMYNDDPRSYGIAYRFDPEAERATRDIPSVVQLIAERASQDPAKYLNWYLLGKPATFLSWGIIAGMGDIFVYPVQASPYLQRPEFQAMRSIALGLHWPMVIAALGAMLILALRPGWLGMTSDQHSSAALVAVIIAYAIGLHMIVAPYPRYGIPFRPLLAVLALLLVRAIWQHHRLASNTGTTRKQSNIQ